jgi:hypothetical protein
MLYSRGQNNRPVRYEGLHDDLGTNASKFTYKCNLMHENFMQVGWNNYPIKLKHDL